jgi:hypothetical protein
MKKGTSQGDKMQKLYLFIISGICGWLLSGCVIVSYTEKTDVTEFILEKRFVDKHYFENLKPDNKFILLEDCYIVRDLPKFEWHILIPVFYTGAPDCLEPRSSLEEWELSKKELQSFEQKGSGSWFYTPPLTFAINRIKEKLPKGSILKIQGFYRSGRYFDFENGASNYILLQDEKSGKEFYLSALLINEKFNNRSWIKPYNGEIAE